MRDSSKRTHLGHPPNKMPKGGPPSRTDKGNPAGRTHSGGPLPERIVEASWQEQHWRPFRQDAMKALPKGHIDETPLAIKVLEALAVHLKREALPKGRFSKAFPTRHIEDALLVRCTKEALSKGRLRKAVPARHRGGHCDKKRAGGPPGTTNKGGPSGKIQSKDPPERTHK